MSGKRAPKAVKLPRARLPDSVRNAYAAELLAGLGELERGVMTVVARDLPAMVASHDVATADRRDAIGDDIAGMMAKLRELAARTLTGARGLALRIGTDVEAFSRAEVSRQLRSVLNVDVFASASPAGRAKLDAFVADNVRLIKSLPDQAMNEIEATVLRGVRAGKRAADIASEIQGRFEVSKSRAVLIARDQVGKFNGEQTELRHREIGIDAYIWRTSRDERVRPEHAAREGKRYLYSDPPEDGNPGEAIQCRCTAEPDLSALLNEASN